jgi:hypothetical protein
MKNLVAGVWLLKAETKGSTDYTVRAIVGKSEVPALLNFWAKHLIAAVSTK